MVQAMFILVIDDAINKIASTIAKLKQQHSLKMAIVTAASKQNVYSQIFRPTTTARLQVVAEKCGMYSWGDNKYIDFFVIWVGTRLSLGVQ